MNTRTIAMLLASATASLTVVACSTAGPDTNTATATVSPPGIDLTAMDR